MESVKYIFHYLFYIFIYRNKFLSSLYYLFLKFFLKKNNDILYENISKIKQDFKNNYDGLVICNSNLNFKNINNLLQIVSFLDYFKGVNLKPLIFNSFNYKKKLSIIDFIAARHFLSSSSLNFFEVSKISNKILKKNYDEILKFEFKNVSCGKYAASTSMRMLRVAKIDLKKPKHFANLKFNLIKSIIYADAAHNFIEKNDVRYAVFNDRGYCGEGELYDVCILNKIKCLQFIATYKNQEILVKKFTKKNRDEHPSSVSDDTWTQLLKLNFDKVQLDYLDQEIKNSYMTNTWYPSAGTMVGKNITDSNKIIEEIGIINKKKIAVIFPHIFWDGTFFYGKDLFENYEEWFRETLKAAEKNQDVNWIIKAHPSNVVKDKQENINHNKQEREREIIEELFNKIPPNFYYLSSKSKINTFYLLNILDFCITVRGTVALEAAMRGKVSIICGTGRYDNKDFTYDFNDQAEYKNVIQRLPVFENSIEQQSIKAKRFAYASLICKNFNPQNISFYWENSINSDLKVKFLQKDERDDKRQNVDDKFIGWLKNDDVDFFDDPKQLWKFDF